MEKAKRWLVSPWNIELFNIQKRNLVLSNGGCAERYLIATLGTELLLSDGSRAYQTNFTQSLRAVSCDP